MRKWMAIPVLAGAVIIGGVGVVANAAAVSKTPTATTAVKSEILSMEEAKAKAIDAVGGEVTKIELDHEKSGDIYEVEVKSNGFEYDLDIDAISGKVLRTEKEIDDTDNDDDDRDEDIIVSNDKYITKEDAVAIAMKQAKGTVTEVEMDKDHNSVKYEIEIQDGTMEYDIAIDAISGKVLKVKQDRDND